MKQKLLSDISSLTNIKYSIINKLKEISEECICDYVLEAILKNDDLIEIDIGIGKISILVLEDGVEYSFRPSSSLEKSISKTILDDENILVDKVEKGLSNRLLSTYKELF